MTDKDIISDLKEKMKADLSEEADKIIEDFVAKFRCKLRADKSLLIARMIDGIEWISNFDNINQTLKFQANITAGRSDTNAETTEV